MEPEQILRISNSAKFEDILPSLVSTYQQGRLVPFLGAGMSALNVDPLGRVYPEVGSEDWLRPARHQTQS
jgi:hypothetical protein